MGTLAHAAIADLMDSRCQDYIQRKILLGCWKLLDSPRVHRPAHGFLYDWSELTGRFNQRNIERKQRNIERNIELAIDSMLGSQNKSELSIIMGSFNLDPSIQRKMKDAIDFMLGINKPEFTRQEEIDVDMFWKIVDALAKQGYAQFSVTPHGRDKFSMPRSRYFVHVKRRSSVRCRPLQKLLLAKEINIVSAPAVPRRCLVLKTQGQNRNGTDGRYSSSPARTDDEKSHSTDAPVAKGNHARPDNDLVITSSENAAVCNPSLGSNASVETPIRPLEGRLVCSGSEPASADNCSITASKTPEPTWYVASAAAHHMTGNLDLLNGYTPMSGDLVVHAANMGPMQVHGCGSVNTANIDLPDVWYVPGLDANLISTSQLAKLGYTITLGPYGCRISKDDEDETLVGKAHFTDDYLFELDFLKVPSAN